MNELPPNPDPASAKSAGGLITRRRLLGAASAGVATAAGMYGYATWVEPHWAQVTQRRLTLRKLPTSLQGKTLVQISDLHIGQTDESYLISALETVNSLRPDLLVITGDIIDHHYPDAIDAVQRIMSAIKPASIATLGCLGNHDYGRRWSEVPVANGVAGAMEDAGVTMLRDRRMDIDGLPIFGMDDLWSPMFAGDRVMKMARGSVDGICLCHNPDACDQPVWSDFRGVVLSGHTHGGQCKPPFLAPPKLPVSNRNYVSGFYDVGENRTLYINRGLGYGFQARFNCRPEITRFTLTDR